MLPIATCLIALAVLLMAERCGWRRARIASKLVASSAFVWAAFAWGATATPYGRLLLLGLVLCWIGDALLLPAGNAQWFRWGILAFMLAHLAYAMAFTRLAPEAILIAAGTVVVGAGAWAVLRWLRPHLSGSLRGLVVVYVGVISVMVVVALAAVGGGGPVAVGAGALGFAVSDLSVARDRFVSRGWINRAWGLPLYYLSQLAIGYSVI